MAKLLLANACNDSVGSNPTVRFGRLIRLVGEKVCHVKPSGHKQADCGALIKGVENGQYSAIRKSDPKRSLASYIEIRQEYKMCFICWFPYVPITALWQEPQVFDQKTEK